MEEVISKKRETRTDGFLIKHNILVETRTRYNA